MNDCKYNKGVTIVQPQKEGTTELSRPEINKSNKWNTITKITNTFLYTNNTNVTMLITYVNLQTE